MNEKLLKEQFKRMERSAIENIVREYGARLTFFAHSFLHDIPAAEDVVQDCIVKLILSPPRLRDETALKTYLFQAVKHRALDVLRKQKREKEYVRESAQEYGVLEERVFQTETQKAVKDALLLLPEQYKEVLYLRYFENLPPKSVAKVMKKTQKQTYNLLSRAKDALRELLNKEVFSNEND